MAQLTRIRQKILAIAYRNRQRPAGRGELADIDVGVLLVEFFGLPVDGRASQGCDRRE